MVIFSFLFERMLHLRGLDTVRITKVKGHAGPEVVLLTLHVGGLVMLSLMLVVTFLVFVGAGTLSFLNFKGSSLPSPGLLLIMVGMMALCHRALRPIRLL